MLNMILIKMTVPDIRPNPCKRNVHNHKRTQTCTFVIPIVNVMNEIFVIHVKIVYKIDFQKTTSW